MKNEKDYTGIIIAIIVALLLLWAMNSNTGSPYGPGCYDADPTQWTEVVCDPVDYTP